jgi:hypothetical protein
MKEYIEQWEMHSAAFLLKQTNLNESLINVKVKMAQTCLKYEAGKQLNK